MTTEAAEIREEIVLENTYGLHARPASKFVQTANRFQSDIFLAKDGREVNGKSIMEIMLLAAEKGTRLGLRVAGPDAREAIQALTDLIRSKFHE